MYFTELKKSYEFEEFTLTKGKRMSWGQNNLRNLKWITYTITWKENDVIPEMWKQYDRVLFTAYKIGVDIQFEASKRVLKTGVSTAKCPNVDLNSGNIHPDISEHKITSKLMVMQLVLVSSKNSSVGPALIYNPPEIQHQEITDKRYYNYSVLVPKACYYPLIDENDEDIVKGEFGYQFLKKIWEEIHK